MNLSSIFAVMVFLRCLCPKKRAYIYMLFKCMKMSTRSIARKCGVSNATVSRIGRTFNSPTSAPTRREGHQKSQTA